MRLTPRKFLAGLATLVAVIALVIWYQFDAIASQRERLADLKPVADELAALRPQRDHLISQLPSELDLARWRTDENELERVRGEVARLRQQVEVARQDSHAPTRSEALRDDGAFENWSHVGQATPSATLQTVLWSITRGDVDTLAGLIGFDRSAADAANQFFASLPDDLKTEYQTPEGLLAAVMVGKSLVHYEAATVIEEDYTSPNHVEARVQLRLPDSLKASLKLRFQRDPAGWKLLVPALIIDGYRHRVLGTTSIAEVE